MVDVAVADVVVAAAVTEFDTDVEVAVAVTEVAAVVTEVAAVAVTKFPNVVQVAADVEVADGVTEFPTDVEVDPDLKLILI